MILPRPPSGLRVHILTGTHDLAAVMPDKIKSVSTRWQGWAQRVGIQPHRSLTSPHSLRYISGMVRKGGQGPWTFNQSSGG